MSIRVLGEDKRFFVFSNFSGYLWQWNRKRPASFTYPYQPLLKITNTVNLMVFAKHYNEYWSIDERRTEHIILYIYCSHVSPTLPSLTSIFIILNNKMFTAKFTDSPHPMPGERVSIFSQESYYTRASGVWVGFFAI